MRIAYFDCFSGASGDMILGSLVDAGLSVKQLKLELGKLHLTHYDLRALKVVKKGIGGTQALVDIDDDYHHQHYRHLRDIEKIIQESDLDKPVKHKSLQIFKRLAEAEAKVHQTPIEQVHFHEVGAMDSIIDVVGSVAGLATMGVERVYCSPFHVGSGTVQCSHGTLPVPAPATVELIIGKPFYSTEVKGELLTPTGAAILTTLAVDFGPAPAMTLDRVGYGAGTAEPAIPNLLRLFIGEGQDDLRNCRKEPVAHLEAIIAGLNPQISDHLLGKLLEMGAIDVFLSPIQMRKNRSGMLLSVICHTSLIESFVEFLRRETTVTGIRWRLDNHLKA